MSFYILRRLKEIWMFRRETSLVLYARLQSTATVLAMFLMFVALAAGQDSFVDFKITGQVPSFGRYATVGLTSTPQCCVPGPIDVVIQNMTYTEQGGQNLVPDPNFKLGLASCAYDQTITSVEPGADGTGNQIHVSGMGYLIGRGMFCPSGLPGFPRITSTPGALYTATFRARVSQSSVGSAAFTVVFLVCNDPMATCESERSSVPLQATYRGIALTQSGFTVNAVAGGSAPPSVKLSILNGETQSFNFKVTTSTITGGNWLSATPASGTVAASTTPATVSITVNPGGLPAGTYYGQVQVDAPGAPNTPQVASVVLNVAQPTAKTAPDVQPTGLIFVSPLGAADPAPQSITMTELLNTGEAFTTDSTFSGSATTWFTSTPANGSVLPNQPLNIQVQPHIKGLANGIYRGTLNITFPNESITKSVDLLLVISPSGAKNNSLEESLTSAPVCSASKLLPVFTLLGSNFNVSAAWPAAIEIKVVDDCSNLLTAGSVVTSFSNGDPPLGLLPLGDGRWAATWAPRNAVTPTLEVVANAATKDLKLQGTAKLGGTVNDNPGVPVVSAGGVVNAASYAASASPSPGELFSIFGVNLADKPDSASSLPLQTQMDGVTVVLGGRPVPLLLVSPGQINAVVPIELQAGSTQIVISKNSQLSLPQQVQIRPAEPATFTVDSSGKGQGLVYVANSDGTQTLADSQRPVKAGEIIVMYCTGLGAVTPAVEAGQQTPGDALHQTTTSTVLTIGGQFAHVLFAGLAPGYTGVYQVNAIVPTGIAAGDAVPVVLSVGGFGGPPVTMVIGASN